MKNKLISPGRTQNIIPPILAKQTLTLPLLDAPVQVEKIPLEICLCLSQMMLEL
jgi:hypothetical protein